MAHFWSFHQIPPSLAPYNNQPYISPQMFAKLYVSSLMILIFVVAGIVVYCSECMTKCRRRHRQRMAALRLVLQSNTVSVVEVAAPMKMGNHGLGVSVLKTLPVFIYDKKTEELGPECAVCSSEFVAGDTGRLLPNCGHEFHTHCIDMWFHFHSNCPLCRSPAKPHFPEPVKLAGRESRRVRI